jgi:hypothetical protein
MTELCYFNMFNMFNLDFLLHVIHSVVQGCTTLPYNCNAGAVSLLGKLSLTPLTIPLLYAFSGCLGARGSQ